MSNRTKQKALKEASQLLRGDATRVLGEVGVRIGGGGR